MVKKTAQPIQKEQEKKETSTAPSAKATWMPRKTLMLIVALALVTVFLLILALAPSLKLPVKTASKPVVASPAHTTLNITQPIVSNSAWSSDVVISTGANKVAAVDLEILYTPTALAKVDINAGTFFNDPVILQKKIDPLAGRITYILGVGLGQKAVSGKGTLATITFVPTGKLSKTSLSFMQQTGVAASGEIRSVLKTALNATFTLASPTP